jgi:pyruvate kinase
VPSRGPSTAWRPATRCSSTTARCAAPSSGSPLTGVTVRIERTPPEGAKLKPEKGLNFPESELDLAPLSADDLRDLDFVAGSADLVGYSFVQGAQDIALLQEELRRRRPDDWNSRGIVAKIETPRAVRNLPGIVVEAAGRQPLAVMIARGDLAVEIGFRAWLLSGFGVVGPRVTIGAMGG